MYIYKIYIYIYIFIYKVMRTILYIYNQKITFLVDKNVYVNQCVIHSDM